MYQYRLDRLRAKLKIDDPDWQPFPAAPQAQAYHCRADIVGYGGAAGGGKTDLLLGKAFTQFYKSIIFRREYKQLADVISRGDAIQDGRCRFVAGDKMRWNTPSGRQVEVGAVQYEGTVSAYKGRPHDFIGFDEAVDFTEYQVRFLMGWLRTDRPDVRPQVVLTFNPPTSPEGEWIIRFFAPWLDSNHPNPAAPGEVRWFVTVDEREREVPGPDPVEVGGRTYSPRSRTYYPARVEDNPVYMATGYDRQLESLPEPLRSQLRWGDFSVRTKDHAWQIVPTTHILAAQVRWEATERGPLVAVGVDPSRGGDDETVIALLYGSRVEIMAYPGSEVPDGPTAARLVMDAVGAVDVPVFVDVVGIGASVYDSLRMFGSRAVPVNAGAGSRRRDKTGRFSFSNLRAEMMWNLREVLDPTSGGDIALPPLPALRADLRGCRYSIVGGKIKAEDKEDVKKRLGRSPDYGDAVMLALHGVGSAPVGVLFDL